MKHFDAAIVGGGPGGAFLAAKLAAAGRKVILVEATSQDRRKVCGEYLCPQGVEELEAAGCARAAEGRAVRGMRLFSPAGLPVDSRFPPGREGAAIRRDTLDPALLASAAQAGALLLRGMRLEEFSEREGRWEMRAGSESFSADLLVGADGRQSFVARTLGVQCPLPSKRVALHFFCATSADTPDFGEMHILPDGSYVGISPVGARELNVSIVCEAEKARGGAAQAAADLLALSADLRSRFLPIAAPVHVAFPISHRVRAVAGKAWALVGDAAGFLDPLTGEGMYQALRSAGLLAESLGAAKGTEVGLARYSREYRRAFAAKTRVNRLFQALIRHPSACEWVGQALRASPSRADAFIGVVGNVFTPREGAKKLFLG